MVFGICAMVQQKIYFCIRRSITWNTNVVWHTGNDGSGSGLDADYDGTNFEFLRSDADTFTGNLSKANGSNWTQLGCEYEMDAREPHCQ